MADEDAPLSSYSDPLYDRLDAITRQIRRQWWIFALAILVVALAAIAFRMWRHSEPVALGGAIAVQALSERDEAKREAIWTGLADGQSHDPAFRAAASIELCQILLSRGDVIKARERAQQAETYARTAGDEDLVLAAGLSRAAATLDGGDAAAALTLYEQASRGSGAKHPARKLAAELGAATCLEKLGKVDEAMARLEPVTTRTDRGAEQLIQVATATYWRLKRAQAEVPASAPAPVESAAAPAAAPAAPVAAPVGQ
jgi:tetratricopeptide (TPR) repeat protein